MAWRITNKGQLDRANFRSGCPCQPRRCSTATLLYRSSKLVLRPGGTSLDVLTDSFTRLAEMMRSQRDPAPSDGGAARVAAYVSLVAGPNRISSSGRRCPDRFRLVQRP